MSTHCVFALIGISAFLAGCDYTVQFSTPTPKTTSSPPVSVYTPGPSPIPSPTPSVSPSPTPVSLPNVLNVEVGAACGTNSYQNEPCVSVTICAPGTTTCQTISDILLDTGSTGLRIFSSLVSIPLTPLTSGGNQVAECAQFGTGSDWGPLSLASVVIGNEPAVETPIQLINAGFSQPPSQCASSDTSPQQAGFNGILGVGLFTQDCGSGCASNSGNGIFFSCGSGGCHGISLPLVDQLQNPISLLPLDNNGLEIQLPSVSSLGASSLSGTLTLGIGTRSNNEPSGTQTFTADLNGNFSTTFNNSTYAGASFIDSGSNGIFSDGASNLPNCSSTGLANGFFCPSSTLSLSAMIASSSGSPQATVGFQVGNAETLMASGNRVFIDLGGSFSGEFDWGLPFFMGRKVFVGIENRASSIGSGAYWAF